MAAGTTSATLGFVVAGMAKPMTLLKGYELDIEKAKPIELVFRRKTGEDKFTDIISGGVEKVKEYKESLNDLLSEELLARMSE